MKLSDALKVNTLVGQRRELSRALERARGDGLGVTIEGRYQDDDMKAAVRDAVVDELRRRIHLIDRELTTLSVTIDLAG